jgi:hypothetical protein
MIILVCSVAIVISVNRFSWSGILGHGTAAAPVAPTGPTHPVVAQEQPQPQFSGPHSSVIMLRSDMYMRLGPVWLAVAALLLCLFAVALVATSKAPALVAFRRQLRQQVRGALAGGDDREPESGKGGDNKVGASGEKPDAPHGAGYGSAQPSDVPAFEPAGSPGDDEAAAVGGFQRLPRANVVRRRWDHMVARMMPEDARSRLHTTQFPLGEELQGDAMAG